VRRGGGAVHKSTVVQDVSDAGVWAVAQAGWSHVSESEESNSLNKEKFSDKRSGWSSSAL
jgi:hypothetical protein